MATALQLIYSIAHSWCYLQLHAFLRDIKCVGLLTLPLLNIRTDDVIALLLTFIDDVMRLCFTRFLTLITLMSTDGWSDLFNLVADSWSVAAVVFFFSKAVVNLCAFVCVCVCAHVC